MRFLRYRTVSLWLILGFAVAFIVFDFRMQSDIRSGAENAALQASSFDNYKVSMRLEMTGENETDTTPYIKEFLTKLCGENNVVTINNLELYFSLGDIKTGVICVSANMPQYPLHKGAYPTSEQLSTGTGYAVVSYSRKNDIYVKNEKEYIDFNGEAFEITGYLDNNAAWLVDGGVIFFPNSNADGLWFFVARFLENGWLYLSVESDEPMDFADEYDEINEYAKKISKNSFYVKYANNVGYTTVGESRKEYSKALTDNQKRYTLYIYLFTVIMLCFVFEFWMSMRKKEFMIMRKNGFFINNILWTIYRDTYAPALLGAGLGKIVNIAIECVFNGYFDINQSIVIYDLMIVIMFLVVTVTLVTLFSVVKMLIGYKKGFMYMK
ncbi:MAG: hypothetical protein NC240_10515 [Clostridium sp.]|nr:hypothetical protein [Clostridium sp.]